MKILATEVKYEELRPGELYSTRGPDVWASRSEAEDVVAWQVWLRGDAPLALAARQSMRYRLDIEVPAHADYSGTLYCLACGRPMRAVSREGSERVEAEMTCGEHHWFVLVGDGWVQGFQCNEGDRGGGS